MTGPSERTDASESRAYRAGVAVAIVTSVLTVWSTLFAMMAMASVFSC
jgi:hypothetical protein